MYIAVVAGAAWFLESYWHIDVYQVVHVLSLLFYLIYIQQALWRQVKNVTATSIIVVQQ
jgi:hypothetical protein